MHLATVRICPWCKHILFAISVGDFLIAARQDALDWVSKVYELTKKGSSTVVLLKVLMKPSFCNDN